MPLTAVPPRGQGMPKLLGTFLCLTPITINVGTGPNSLFLAETPQQLMSISDDGTVDALAIDAAVGPFTFWVIGEVWVAGSQGPGATFKPFIFIPGNVSAGGQIVAGQPGYGTGPSVAPSSGGLFT